MNPFSRDYIYKIMQLKYGYYNIKNTENVILLLDIVFDMKTIIEPYSIDVEQ